MTGKDLKIWLIEHDYNQSQLADKLKVTTRTISKHANNEGKLPALFTYAIKGITNELEGK